MSNRLFGLRKRDRFPLDILGALSLTVLCSVVVLFAAGTQSSLSVLFGLPLLLFLPGYVLVTALFPTAGLLSEWVSDDITELSASTQTAMGPIESITLTVIGSISLTMLVGFSLTFTPWGITVTSTIISLCGVVLLIGTGAVYRRSKLPPQQRPAQLMSWQLITSRKDSDQGMLRRDVFVTGLSGFALLFGGGTAVYAITDPPRDEYHSQFYLLTEDDNGDMVADNYPKEFNSGESNSIIVGITNNERATTSYEAFVELQRVEEQGDDLEIVDREELERYSTSIRTTESEHTVLDLEPTITGEQLRLVFLLYRDNIPTEPSAETAYQSLHLWIDVSES